METALDLLRRCGLGAKYRGFPYLATAIDLAIEDESRLNFVTKWLYPAVAAQYHTTWACVERNMRTAISVCWDRNRPYLEELAGYPLAARPGTTDFITIVVNHMLRTKTPAG